MRTLLVVLLLLPGSALAKSAGYKSTLIKKVPFVKQKTDFCGEACVEMAMRKLGHKLTQDDFFAVAGIDPLLGRGALAKEMRRGLKTLGFDVGKVWYRIDRRKPRVRQVAAQFKKLHADLVAGVPTIVCMYYDHSPRTTQHFRLILGYDKKKDQVIYHEPAEKKGSYNRMSRRRLLATWPLRYKERYDILVRIPLRVPKGDKIKIPKLVKANHSPADYVQHIMTLNETLGGIKKRFRVLLEPPYVVVAQAGLGRVRATARRLWAHYFKKKPPKKKIVTLWLFKSRRSYHKTTKRLTGRKPKAPLGFYDPKRRTALARVPAGPISERGWKRYLAKLKKTAP